MQLLVSTLAVCTYRLVIQLLGQKSDRQAKRNRHLLGAQANELLEPLNLINTVRFLASYSIDLLFESWLSSRVVRVLVSEQDTMVSYTYT